MDVYKLRKPSHVHEFAGDVQPSEEGADGHMHRFAGVTGEEIPVFGGRHRHEYFTNTSYFVNHHHAVKGLTEPDVAISESKHVHLISGRSSYDDEHLHFYEGTTFVN